LVHTRIKEWHPLAISANVVNQQVLALEHFHFGAIYPFVAERSDRPSYWAAESWRPSERPLYPKLSPPCYDNSNCALLEDPPYQGHTWLLLPGDSSWDLQKTPVGINFHYNAGLHDLWIGAWQSWAIGAQQQYSLLRNIELNQIARYFFGRPISYLDAKGKSLGRVSQRLEREPEAEQLFDT
jgi:hypothetical protein